MSTQEGGGFQWTMIPVPTTAPPRLEPPRYTYTTPPTPSYAPPPAVAAAPPMPYPRSPARPLLTLGSVTGPTWQCPDGEQAIIDESGRAVEMVMGNCHMLVVNGAVGRMQTDGFCPFLIDLYNVRQTVTVRDQTVTWRFQDAGTGLLTLLNQKSGGGWATLDKRTGVIKSSMGDTEHCYKVK
jgi:hypothetical protein